MNGLPNVEQNYSIEFVRKGIHLCSLSIPISYYFMSKATALTILVPLMLLFAGTDIARFFLPSLNRWYDTYFGWLLRSHERDLKVRRLNGATYVLLSAVLCVLFFPKIIVISAFAILIISDSLAALVGRKYGRHKFMKKSLEGSAAFFLSAIAVVLIAPKITYSPAEYLAGGIAALVGAVVEASPIPLDDNFSIPLTIGIVMWLLYSLFLPELNIFALEQII